MTRRTAAERHLTSAPRPPAERDPSDELAELLVAFHHPIRRWLTELLGVQGPANVGHLAAATGLAVGSVSHHLKVLHQQDLIEPAPELARDTRESWWRLKPRTMTWSVEDFDEGTLGRRVAQTAEAENLRYQVRAMQDWLRRAPGETAAWRTAANSVDTYVAATEEQVRDLARRLSRLVKDWSEECMAAAEEHPDDVRRPVRAVARVFPSEPVRP
ncbi:MAG TPA: ArsR family transcriptional regulator [Nocardioides sp.]|jgi:DNA-binding transcriptional ArsR family regulator|uniref:ArsR/SmtB family transcription factor n=1 Tax=Nocardioides sp. TaxID=35761 RepID=UPI002E3070F6|nr:ArsR family transcriptional regulator [Nocardioides sp.]HEX3931665.1 ArsR family transcriptional regulator [Nocardioides sp.]